MNRRQYLAGLATLGAGSLAGCSSLFETQSTRAPPLVEDRPDAVYVPSHVEGMRTIGVQSAGRLRLALSYSFPHRFWLVDGDRTNRVDIEDGDAAHLMLSAWDAETGRAIPTANPSIAVREDGETIVPERSPWRMLSQNMGFHFGDNVALDGDGTYTVEVTFGPVDARRTGAFRDAFGERATPSFTWEYSRSRREEISFERLDDRKGERAAVDPMQMEMLPVPQLPTPEALPGSIVGRGASGDATFVVVTLDSPPEGIEGSGAYLAVSPRTPYNRFPLPFAALSATLSRGSEAIFEGSLTPTLDPTLGYHYGAAVDAVESGDSLAIATETLPQISRHEGYETAFLEMPPVEMAVER